ncbi:hypothetical protein F5X99DRAFT_426239 [Biscogniauxia marginata]|nr:hypothetical protein F5X99DRAFT_426239 [Biscogniauxia marginata]
MSSWVPPGLPVPYCYSSKPNSESSSQSDGGAPLRSSSDSGAPAQETTRSESPTDEETALVRASVKFGDLNDPFTESVNVPQSVAPTTYRVREGIPVPSPIGPTQQRSNVYPQATPSPRENTGAGMLTRYRNSFSSNDSRASGWAPNAGPAAHRADVSMQMTESIHRRIMTTIQYINVSPGCPSELANKHSQMLQEISQLVNSTVNDLRRDRDRAHEARNEEHEKFKQALYDESQTREQRDKAQQDLKLAIEREQLLKQRIEMLNDHLDMAKRQVKSVEEDAKRFQEHHAKVTRDYKGQDETHYKQIQALENEIKILRLRNSELATAAGVSETSASIKDATFSPASVPESCVKVDDEGSRERSGLKEEDAAMLLENLKASAKKAGDTSGKRGLSFIPNPKAPAWAPPAGKPWGIHGSSTTNSPIAVHPTATTHTGIGPLVKHNPLSHGIYGTNDVRSSLPFPGRRDTDDSALSHHSDATIGGPSAPYGSRGNPVPPTGTPAQTPRFGYAPFATPKPEDKGSSGEEIWMPRDPNSSGVIPRDKAEWDASDVQVAVERLYELTKGYVVNCHKKGPPNVESSALQAQEPQTWIYLTGLVYDNPKDASSHMRYLMNNDQYTAYVIQRMCVDYLFKKIVAPQVYMGFSSEMDGHLNALQAQISTIAQGNNRTTSRARQRVIEEHARLIQAIVASDKIKHFRSRVVDRHASMLAHILEPLRSRNVSHEQALKSLRIMVAATWDISTKVWTGGMTLHYVFPDTGSKYAFGTMDALNGRQVAPSPELLQFSQCRISLVVTPTLTLRDDRDRDYLKTFGIHRAEVLVMK